MGNVGIFDMKQIRAVPPSFDADVEPLLRPGPEPYPTAVENFEAALLPSCPIYNSRYQGEPAAIGNCSGGGSVLFTL
jgi:hypothetical protein